ncbi:RNA-guided endonuclease InsQ/TnpB family protein, partial [Bifidobacterium longum]|uniref:RNA-guided endonuclease InsQ/TnpB family protein n=1 Tax=Bifidobacterium longum TaxID=216816 RepID=UPI00103F1DC9
KTKGSNNHAKTRLLKAKTHGRIRNQRRDMAYKLASKVAGENQAVALETLNVKGLARTRMAKSLLDANWTRIIDRIRQLGIQYGRTIVQIDRWYPSSQICSHCGRRDGRKPLDVREWECTDCGAFLDRDWNAALNILDAAGLAESLNARGGDVRRRLAQAGRNADAREAGTRRTVSLH